MFGYERFNHSRTGVYGVSCRVGPVDTPLSVDTIEKSENGCYFDGFRRYSHSFCLTSRRPLGRHGEGLIDETGFEFSGFWIDPRRSNGFLGPNRVDQSEERPFRCRITRLGDRENSEGDPPKKRREAVSGRRACLERGAESGTALEEGNPEGMFGLSGTMTRERIPTEAVVVSRPRGASRCDRLRLSQVSFQRRRSELPSFLASRRSAKQIRSSSSRAIVAPVELSVLNRFSPDPALSRPASTDVPQPRLSASSGFSCAPHDACASGLHSARSPGSRPSATDRQQACSSSLDFAGKSRRAGLVKNVWADRPKAAQPLQYWMGEGWGDLDSARTCGVERGPDGVKAESDRVPRSPGQAMGKEETAQ